MVVFPIIGAFLEAFGVILEKRILKNRWMNFKNYTVYSFLSIILIMLPFIYFMWDVNSEAFQLKNILFLCFVIVTSSAANLLIFYSLKRENINEFEPLWLMQPLFTVFLAVIFYSNERNWIVVLLSLIASITLVLTHIKKRHIKLDRYNFAALFGSFLFAVELVLSKRILEFYSPFSLYFIRCFFIFFAIGLLFRPSFKIVEKKKSVLSTIFFVGVIWVLYRVILYYGYLNIGIVYTTILFILSPVLMLVFAFIFLKERPTLRQFISTSIILICVVLALIFGSQ